jgi:hypothetical protein
MGYDQQVFTYSPSYIRVMIGTYIISGLVNVKVVKEEKTFKVVKGIRGKNTRVRNFDESYSITLELQQTDPVNDFLSDMHIADKKDSSGFFEIIITDLNGNSRFVANYAFVEDFADLDFSSDFDNRVWIIKTTSNSGVFIGGNDTSQRSPNLTDINNNR